MGAAYGERSVGVYDDIFPVHLLDLASREAEGPFGRTKRDVGRAFGGVRYIAIDHDVGILTQGQRHYRHER